MQSTEKPSSVEPRLGDGICLHSYGAGRGLDCGVTGHKITCLVDMYFCYFICRGRPLRKGTLAALTYDLALASLTSKPN